MPTRSTGHLRSDRSADCPPSTPPTGPGTQPTAPPAAAKASDAVNGYLQALAAGNVATALSYAAEPPADKTLLTTEVFAGPGRRHR